MSKWLKGIFLLTFLANMMPLYAVALIRQPTINGTSHDAFVAPPLAEDITTTYCRNDPINNVDPLGLTTDEYLNTTLRYTASTINKYGQNQSSRFVASASGFVASLVDDTAYIGSAQSSADFYNSAVRNTTEVMKQQMDMGACRGKAALVGVGYATGKIVGYTDAYEAGSGFDAATHQKLSGSERATRTASATAALAGTAVGLKTGYTPAGSVQVPSVPVLESPVVTARNPVAGSIRNVNPLGGDMNCVNCSIATDATLARTPASALGGGPQPLSVLERQFGGQFGPVSGPIEIGSTLSRSGNGARGIVYGANPAGDVGHVWNAVNQDGTIRFLDGQTGGLGVDNFDYFTNFRFLSTSPGAP